MARVTLNNETYNAATDGSEISGNTGTEQVNVFAGVTDLEVAGNIERVDLPGDIADFTFSSFGNSLTILDGSGNVVAAVSDAGGKQVVFEDGALDVAYDGTTLTVGGETVGGTAAAITPAQAEIDDTTTSDSPDAGTGGGGTGGTTDDQVFTLTTDIGEQVTGGSGNDTFNVITGTGATLNAFDVIDGGAGTDTLNLMTDTGAATLPTSSQMSNVEIIQAAVDSGVASIDSSGLADVTEVNVAGDASALANSTLGEGQALTLSDTGTLTTHAAVVADGVNSLDVTLDDVANGFTLVTNETTAGDLETVNVSGSGGAFFAVSNTPGTSTTLNLAVTSDSGVSVASFVDAITLDASDSTGDLTINASTLVDLETFTGSAGVDALTMDLSALLADAVSVDLGTGNDSLSLDGSAPGANVAFELTGGAGNDTLEVTNTLANIVDASEANFEDGLISFMDFDGTEDVLDISSALTTPTTLTNTQLASIEAESSLFDAVENAEAVLGTNASGAFDYGSDAYIFENDGTAGFGAGDGLLKLVGMSVEDFDSSNYIV